LVDPREYPSMRANLVATSFQTRQKTVTAGTLVTAI
jgi:hypothetical protein